VLRGQKFLSFMLFGSDVSRASVTARTCLLISLIWTMLHFLLSSISPGTKTGWMKRYGSGFMDDSNA